MDFTEVIFKRLFKFLKKDSKQDSGKNVQLKDHLSRLTLIARALSGRPIDILPAENIGGWKGNVFFLPAETDLFGSLELNLQFYLFRVIYLSRQQELNMNWHNNTQEIDDSASIKMATDSSNEILIALDNDYPGISELHRLLKGKLDEKAFVEENEPEMSWLYGKWMYERIAIPQDTINTPSNNEKSEEDEKNNESTEMDSKPVEEIITLQVDKEKQEEYVFTHNFEKVETADEFNGSWRDFDTDDSLKEQFDALQELSLKHTVRVDDMVHSIYKADMAGTLTIAESKTLKEEGFHYSYPEWDSANHRYKEDFCKVYPMLYRTPANAYASDVLKKNGVLLNNLKRSFAQYDNQLEKVNRLSHGEDFDLDAVVELLSDVKAKCSGNEKVYYSKRKKKKKISLLFLLDLSLSSDSYAAGNKVIDVEKMLVILLGEVMNEYDIDFQVDGFFSRTRNFCSYFTLKHFKDNWTQGKWNIGKVSPQGYTRIGPALRHAGNLLSVRPSERKWVILLSDGKPNDYDRYEGRYGVSDIKKALTELEKKHIHSYAFAIEDRARYYLPQMFGNNHYCVISDPKELLFKMSKLYARLITG